MWGLGFGGACACQLGSARLSTMTTATTRKNRRTGATVTARLDDFLGWITVCETHGGYAEHPTKTAARDWLAEPTMWCEGCAEAVAR